MKTLKQRLRGLSKKEYAVLREYCKHSNSLYNCCLYILNEHYKQTGGYLGFSKLYHEIKSNEHYIGIPRKMGNQIIKLIDQNYRSFFVLLRQKRSGSYNGDVNPPKYKKPGSLFNLILDNQQLTIKNQILKITKTLKIPFTHTIGKPKQAVIKPFLGGKYFEIYITYETENKNITHKKNNIISIDLGLDNLITCYSNVGRDFIISGKTLKSYNQFYNKKVATIKSELKKYNKKYRSNRLEKININRNNWINSHFNQAVSKTFKEIVNQKIKKVVIGYNKKWKKEINIGSKNNQNFCYIPHYKLVTKLKNRLESCGVEVIFQEESYTSKCSALDLEQIKKHEKYSGNRIHRGLFKTENGLILNADINGAINIMRKVVPDEIVFSKGIERCTVHPKMLDLFNS